MWATSWKTTNTLAVRSDRQSGDPERSVQLEKYYLSPTKTELYKEPGNDVRLLCSHQATRYVGRVS